MNEELQKGNSVFLIELDKIEVNPYQPRIEFDEEKIKALAESIKQYGIIQPIVVSRREEYSEEFGIKTKYQIIAGERRFRASKLIGLNQIPAIIRTKEDTDAEKLELAIIENLQREDLNPVDKARAFRKLADDFGLKHAEIAKKMGKSREYVSNAMRILMLPENILAGLTSGKISEGHTRSLLMLKDRPEEQIELYKRIVADKLTVRAAEKLARNIAVDKIRKKVDLDPEIKDIENHIREKLGTKVSIDQKPIGDGGKLTIEFFNKDDLKKILAIIESDDVSNNLNVSNLNTSDLSNNDIEVNNFEDIQPTVFKEEIDRIEQFANSGQGVVKNDEVKIDNFKVEENRVDEINNEEVEKIQYSSNDLLSNAEQEYNTDSFNGFSIGQDENKITDKDIIVKNDNFAEEKKVENLNLNSQSNIQDEINKELENINNFSKNVVENVEEDVIKKVDGLERVEIKNDFDRARIDAFAKSDDILKSFNKEEFVVPLENIDNNFAAEKNNNNAISEENLNNSVLENKNDVVGNNENVDNFFVSKISNEEKVEGGVDIEKDTDVSRLNTINSEPQLNNNNSQDDYSDLYAEFLKSKNSIENGGENILTNKESVEVMDNEFSINSADNIVVEKEVEDLTKNVISNANNTYLDSKVDNIEPVVDIITHDSSDFLAAAEEHKNNLKDNDVVVDEYDNNDDVLKKDDKYSFKGFSL